MAHCKNENTLKQKKHFLIMFNDIIRKIQHIRVHIHQYFIIVSIFLLNMTQTSSTVCRPIHTFLCVFVL